jgi:predicted transposase/invertase (TIGR01784 family)
VTQDEAKRGRQKTQLISVPFPRDLIKENMLGNLDNEVIFKKAFTDKFVLKCLVKDLFGVAFEPEIVETEKRFEPKVSSIDFKYDIFAESKDKRVIVEIQRVDYDYNFDRFLLYHNMAIAEMQRTSREYKTDRVVYTIAVFTGKYVARERQGALVEKDILFHHSNLFDLDQKEYDVFGHKLIFLNHNYVQDTTPQGYRDWLILVRESIKSPENPQVNLANDGVRKVTELIDYEHLSPEERTESKNRNAAESAKYIYEKEAQLREKIEIAKNAILEGFENGIIAKLTGLSIEQIQGLHAEMNK